MAAENTPIIRVEGLTKHFHQLIKQPGLGGALKSIFRREYRIIEAVKDLEFTVDEGEFVGFIGPNGAGKTTSLKCLSGLLYPTSGSVNVLGFDPVARNREFLTQISLVMGQKNQLWWDLPAYDSFLLNKEIYKISDKAYKTKLEELVELLDLEEFLDVQVRKLSLGQRMRCELAVSLLHNPKVLFLDEPTIGLDVVMQKKLREFLGEYNREYGTTIILTSHNMDDVAALAKRILIIDYGELVYDGGIKGLIKGYVHHKYISLHFTGRVYKKDLAVFGDVVDFDKTSAMVSVPREDVAHASAALLSAFPVDDLEIKEIDLDEVISNIFVTGL